MNRSLYCRKCGEASKKKGMHPEDKKMGWTGRWHYVSPVMPKGHGITLITGNDVSVLEGKGNREFIPMSSLYCDQCGEPITGDIALARTMWHYEDEPTPPLWENDYGNILPPQAVAVMDALTDGKNPSST